MASPFELALGLYQGRIRPTNWTPEGGDYVWQLGHDLPGQVVRLSFGADENRIAQSIDVTGVQLIRLVIHERGPAEIPPGQVWRLEGQIDSGGAGGAFTYPLAEGRTRTRRDLAFDVHDLTGAHDFDIVLFAAGSGVHEAELPGVYVDALQFVTAEPLRPAIFNRDPEPGDTGVPLDRVIAFDLVDLDGVGVASTFTVLVDGVAAIDAGVLQSPWSGSGSQITPRTDGFTVGLVPATNWASLSEHTVRVQASTTDGAQIDVSWTWTAADFTPPQVVSAFAPAHDQVRVTFDEPLGDGATTAANYTVALVSGAPAVTPVVTAAAIEAPGVVLLTLDIAQTPLAVYSVTVADVEDAKGNVIAAPYNVAQWTGYACPKPPGRDVDLYLEWPATWRASDTGDLRGFIAIEQELVDLILCELDRFHERVLDPDTAEERWVNQMLRDMGSPFSFLPLSLTDKRRLLRVLRALLARRGTEDGIESAIRTLLGIDVEVGPITPAGTPGLGVATASGTFALASGALAKMLAYDITSPTALTDEQRLQIRRIAAVMRRGVCHLRRIVEPGGSPPGDLAGLGVATFSGTFVLGGP